MLCTLILGGEPPPTDFLIQKAQDADYLIAADSGYDALDGTGLHPDVLVGDFDSVKAELPQLGVKVIHAPEQTATDFEKALRFLPETTRHLRILGATGRRIDHFLTNLLIAENLPSVLKVSLEDPLQTIIRVTPDCPLKGSAPPGATASLIPFTRCQAVTTHGFRWNLHERDMSAADQLSQSNLIENATISIRLRGGCLFAILNH